MKKVVKKRLLIIFLFLGFIIFLRFLNVHNCITVEQINKHQDYLQSMIRNHYVVSVLLFCLIFIGATVAYIPVTVLLTIAAGFFFGAWFGMFYSVMSATIGSVILFLLVRYLMRSIIQKRYKKQLEVFNNALEKHGYSYLLTLQLLPATPTFLINTLAGLTSISLWTFGWATFVGILPGSLLYTYAGQQLHKMTALNDLFSIQFLILFSLLALFALLPVLIHYVRNR